MGWGPGSFCADSGDYVWEKAWLVSNVGYATMRFVTVSIIILSAAKYFFIKINDKKSIAYRLELFRGHRKPYNQYVQSYSI